MIYRARPEALLGIYRWEQLIASHLLNRPQSSPNLPLPPEALPKSYSQTQLFSSLSSILQKKHNSSVSAGGAGQIPQANAINDKFQSVFAIGTHHPSSHAGGAAQFPRANAINVGSHPVPPICIHIHSGRAGGAAQFPQAHPINDKAWLLMEGNDQESGECSYLRRRRWSISGSKCN